MPVAIWKYKELTKPQVVIVQNKRRRLLDSLREIRSSSPSLKRLSLGHLGKQWSTISLDLIELANYMLVSNSPYLGKIIERMVAIQL